MAPDVPPSRAPLPAAPAAPPSRPQRDGDISSLDQERAARHSLPRDREGHGQHPAIRPEAVLNRFGAHPRSRGSERRDALPPASMLPPVPDRPGGSDRTGIRRLGRRIVLPARMTVQEFALPENPHKRDSQGDARFIGHGGSSSASAAAHVRRSSVSVPRVSRPRPEFGSCS